MNKSVSIVTLTRSLIALQGELTPMPKDGFNPFHKSKYTCLATIWEAIRPLLAKHGFAVSQLAKVQDNQIVLTTLLMHDSGEWLSSDLLVTPIKQSDPQAAGSALTYARRYALSAMLGICSEEDDDAEAATDRTKAKTKAAPSKPTGESDISEIAREVHAQQQAKPTEVKSGEFANAGEFLTTCTKEFGLNKSQVLNCLGATSLDNVNFADAYTLLREGKFGVSPPEDIPF